MSLFRLCIQATSCPPVHLSIPFDLTLYNTLNTKHSKNNDIHVVLSQLADDCDDDGDNDDVRTVETCIPITNIYLPIYHPP